MLATDAYAEEVRADEDDARELGITGVPFFVIGGRYAVSGAQPAELLLRGDLSVDRAARAHRRARRGRHLRPRRLRLMNRLHTGPTTYRLVRLTSARGHRCESRRCRL